MEQLFPFKTCKFASYANKCQDIYFHMRRALCNDGHKHHRRTNFITDLNDTSGYNFLPHS